MLRLSTVKEETCVSEIETFLLSVLFFFFFAKIDKQQNLSYGLVSEQGSSLTMPET